MYQNDYIIAFDENGTPYIAHSVLGNAVNRVASAVKNTRGNRQNHKYILKVFENGRTRYFYKQEEVKAYYEAKKRGIKNAAEYAQNAVKDKASDVADAVKNTAANAKGAIREATGQAARDRMDEAAARRDTEAANMQANKQSREASRSSVQSARQATREAEAERNRSEASLKGLKDKLKSDNEKAIDVTSKAVDALIRKYEAESKARKASLDRGLSMPWEFQKRKDAKAVQAEALREGQQAEKEHAELKNEYDRINKSRELTKKAYSTELAKSNEARNQRARALRNQDAAEKSYQVAQDKYNESRAAYREADSNYNKNKAAYDKSLAGAVDRTAARARDVASDAREAASSAYNKAKDSANNTITNAKNRFERMKGEFRDKAEQAATKASDTVKDTASSVIEKAKDIAGYDERDRRDAASDYAWHLASKGKLSNEARDQQRETEKQYRKTPLGMVDTARDKIGLTARKAMKDLEAERDRASISNDPSGIRKFNADSMARSAKAMYQETPLGKLEAFVDNPRVTVKDSVKGMIDNARSSTAKAVNEAWDRIPKNSDGTVNPFDKNFQSTYNDWKAKKDKYDSSLAGRAKDAAEKATDSVKDMIDQAKKTAKDAAASAQSTIDNATGNNYRKRAQEANQAAENAINQRSRTNDQLENQRSKYGSKENDQDHIYGDSEGYYYKTKEQRDRAEALISKRDQYDADIVNNNRASKVNDNMYADSKAGKINDILGRSNVSTSERANSKATEVQNKWARQEAESKLIGGRLDPNINVSKEYVYSRASNSGMAGQVRQVMQLEEAMRDAERAYDNLGKDSSKPQSSSRAARNKMLDAQKAYNEAYEELIDDINKQYDRDLAAYEKQYGKYNR